MNTTGTELKGYWGKILLVDLSEKSIEAWQPEESLLVRYLGGSGIGARLLFDLTGPATDPLGPENVLIWMTGPFTATNIPMSGRHQIVSKSPLTGIYGEGDAGGRFGTALKKSGWDGIIVKGVSESPVNLLIIDDEIKLEPADALWGRDAFHVDEHMKERFGRSCETSCIGPSGEKMLPISCIVHDGENARMVGRCGLGAVMGSKRLKCVAVRGNKETELASPDMLLAKQKEVVPAMVEKMKGMKLLGTAGGAASAEKMGDMPVKNWSRGDWPAAEKISGQLLADTILRKNYYCGACPVGCGRDVEIKEGRWAGVSGAGPEYETLGMLGGACMVEDLEAIVYAADLCNRYGIDTIETGSAIAMLMECYENGIVSLEDCDGIKPEWGGAAAMVELVKRACEGEGVGKLLSLGAAGMAKALEGSDFYAIHVKGLALPAHDPRCFNTMAIGYATSNRGACHLAGASYFYEKTAVMPEYGYDKPRPRYTEGGEARLNVYAQNLMCVLDSLKVCKFSIYGGVSYSLLAEWYEMVTGSQIGVEGITEAGERIFNVKRMYNVRHGIGRKDDNLPERIATTARNDEATGTYIPDLQPMLEEYYRIRGWDANGVPTPETLERLGLAEMKEYLP